MDELVEISIPVDAEAAKALGNVRKREAVGRVISRMLKLSKDENPLLAAIERLSADAESRGLTHTILDDELAAYNAERREPGSPAT